ncbi:MULTISPECIES: hypothetical protein [unclassified Novosphingobium]|uniref:hypothetical protein n=1 Tax=unclassified Novosphingobium TaxID=2644732 RepID=UPI0006C8CCF5|nr:MULTISPECIES: hypothetical protein [unclassified Novosphingobium]MPS71210.1 hypothetical protein [Novosphingobium sp.]TCM28095.1 hypothetical protein EDF59_1304 [Novosphingobium sp. ST904]
MTSIPANDAGDGEGLLLSAIDMSVLDLAIFLRVHRADRPTLAGEVSATVEHWFACPVDPREVERGFRRMLERGWIVRRSGGVRPTVAGRRHSRTHLRGLVRMMDQGTKMLDVARLMSVLNLAMIELDGEHEVDDDQDA